MLKVDTGPLKLTCACPVRVCCHAGLRGVTADIIVLEEAAHINPELFFTVIAPLMGVQGTAVLGISTPNSDDDNYYSMLMDLPHPEDPNKTLFHTIAIGLACDVCVSQGCASSCTHKADLIPHWKSAARQRTLEKIMEANPLLHARENMGMRANDTHYLFRPQYIQNLRDRTPIVFPESADVVFCAVDPSGGGSQSDYAMATIARINGVYAIVGLDHTPSAESAEVEAMVYRHLADIRNNPAYQYAIIVFYVEANMSWIEVDRMRIVADRATIRPIYFAAHNTKDRLGVVTDEHTKIAYVDTLKRLLCDDRIGYASEFISADAKESQAELERQLRAFRRAVHQPGNVESQKARVYLTGKGSSRKDDLLLSLMMALYFSFLTREDPNFTNMCKNFNMSVD